MNRHTRVLNAMEGKAVDRVPVTFYTHFLTPEAARDNTVPAQIAWFEDCNMDCLCIEVDGYMQYPGGGNAQSLESWRGLKCLPGDHPYFTKQVDRAKRIREGIRDGGVFYMIFTPFSTIKHTMESETGVMEFYREGKEILDEAMKVIEEDTFRLAERIMKETGVDGLFVSLQNAGIDKFTAEEYREYLRPWDLRLLAHANSLAEHNIVHMCSWTGVPNRMELWQDYDYKTVNWAVSVEKDMDLRQGRAFFRPGTTVMGGFDNRPQGILYHGSREEIKAYTKEQLKLAGQTGTILCADCSVQQDQSPERIRYVVEACEEYAAQNGGTEE